jgi:hypothetical protein
MDDDMLVVTLQDAVTQYAVSSLPRSRRKMLDKLCNGAVTGNYSCGTVSVVLLESDDDAGMATVSRSNLEKGHE